MKSLHSFSRWITRHRGSLVESRHFRIHLLAWLLFFSMIVTGLVFLYLLLFAQAEPYRFHYMMLILALIGLFLAAFLLNRYGCYLASAGLFVASSVAGPWGSLLLDPGVMQGDFVPLVYVALAVLLSSILLPLTITIVLAVLQYAALLLVLLASPAADVINLPSFFAFMFFFSGLGIISNMLNRHDLDQIGRQHEKLLELSEQLKEQSIKDHLTGLFNRRYLESTLDQELLRASEQGIPIGIIMLDIDRFKGLNDSFGHGAGDKILQALGSFLSSQVRIADVVCRYGGDEFVIVLPGSSRQMTQRLAEKIRANVRDIRISEEIPPIAVSQGVAVFPNHGQQKQVLMEAADAALYCAKQGGRDRVCISP